MKHLFALFAITLSFAVLTAGNLIAGSCNSSCGDGKDKTEEKENKS